MLKRITILVLIFVVSAANFSTALVYAGFKLNQQFIAANLCMNQLKPGLHCNGHCYFMRKLKQAGDNEKKQAAKSGSNRLEASYFQKPFSISFLEPALLNQGRTAFPVFSYKYTSHYLASIFRPPKSFA